MSQSVCARCFHPFFTTSIIIQGAVYCNTCGYAAFQAFNSDQPLPPISAPAPAVPDGGMLASQGTGSTLWKCQQCAYEYNSVRDHQQCQLCNSGRPGAALCRSFPSTAPAVQSPPQRYDSTVWTCGQCGCAFCLPEDKFCQQCGAAKGGAIPAAWLCPRCNQSNHDKNEYCNRCGNKRATSVEVIIQGHMWVCRRCQAATHMLISKCSGCGFVNQSVTLLKEAFGVDR